MNWIHTACTENVSFYAINEKKGFEASEEIGILAYYVGILVHDHLSSYYKYKTMDHSECNAHIIRYLKSIVDIFKREEAEEFITFMVKLNNQKKVLVQQGAVKFEDNMLEEIRKEYSDILNRWKNKYDEITKDLTKKKEGLLQ